MKNHKIISYIIFTAALMLVITNSAGNPISSVSAQQQHGNNTTPILNNETNQTSPSFDNLTTFTTSGFLRSVEVPQQNANNPYIIFGYWNASVNREDMSNFYSNFTMSRANGSEIHNHQITNFKPTSSVFLNRPAGNSILIFAGTADIHTNNQPKWNKADVAILINNYNTISIAIDSRGTDNHFNGQPIGGIVESIKDPNMKELLYLIVNPAPTVIPIVPTDSTISSSNQTNTNTKDSSGILANIGNAVKDLFTSNDKK